MVRPSSGIITFEWSTPCDAPGWIPRACPAPHRTAGRPIPVRPKPVPCTDPAAWDRFVRPSGRDPWCWPGPADCGNARNWSPGTRARGRPACRSMDRPTRPSSAHAGSRAGVQRAARWIVPHGHLPRTIRRRRALQIADLGPVSELVEAAFGIVEILVEVARLGTDRRDGFGPVVTAFTLIGVGDHIVDGVARPGWVHPVHGGRVGGDIESSFGLFPVPYIRQSDPARPAV